MRKLPVSHTLFCWSGETTSSCGWFAKPFNQQISIYKNCKKGGVLLNGWFSRTIKQLFACFCGLCYFKGSMIYVSFRVLIFCSKYINEDDVLSHGLKSSRAQPRDLVLGNRMLKPPDASAMLSTGASAMPIFMSSITPVKHLVVIFQADPSTSSG